MKTLPSGHRRRGVRVLSSLGAVAFILPHAVPQGTLQGTPQVSLREPQRRSFMQFSALQAGSVRVLSSGALIVLDRAERRVWYVSRDGTRARAVGREGSGPLEYSRPTSVLPARGDSTWVFDLGQLRYLVLDPSGAPVRTFRLSGAEALDAQSSAMPATLNVAQPRAVDAAGRIYFESASFVGSSRGPRLADSVPVLRVDLESARLDTLVWLHVPTDGHAVLASEGIAMTATGRNPLQARDEWAVFANGEIAVARHAPFAVERTGAGRRRSPTLLPFSCVRVTEADRDAEEERRSASRRAGRSPLPPLTDYPECFPPFRRGSGSVWARPNGDLWIVRASSLRRPSTRVDIVSPLGRNIGGLDLGADRSLLGFLDADTVLVARVDANGFSRIEWHAVR